MQLSPFNSFEDWDLVRGALVWLGEADPSETIKGLRANDSKREEKSELFTALLSEFGLGKEFMPRGFDEKESLKRRITRLLHRPEFNTRAAGKLLRRHRDQPFMGVSLRSRSNGVKQTVWWLEGEPEPELREACGIDDRGQPQDDCPF